MIRALAVATAASAAVALAACGASQPTAPQPTAEQTYVIVVPTSEAPTVTGDDQSTTNGRLTTCRQLKYMTLIAPTEINVRIAEVVVARWALATTNKADPRYMGCVVEDPSSAVGTYLMSTYLISDVVPPIDPSWNQGEGLERVFEAKVLDQREVQGNATNIEQMVRFHVVFVKHPGFELGWWLIRGLALIPGGDETSTTDGTVYGTM